jgi:hypothetical protein
MEQKIQQMGQMVEHQSALLQEAQQGKESDELRIKAYEAETKRLQALGQPLDPQVVAHVATQVVMQMMQTGSPEGGPPPDSGGNPVAPPQQQSQPNPPSAGFSLPAQPQQGA